MLQFSRRLALVFHQIFPKPDTNNYANCDNYASRCLLTWRHSAKKTKFRSKVCMGVKVTTQN